MTVAETQTVQKALEAPPVSPGKLLDAAAMQQQWFVEVNNDVTPEDLKRPAFWAHCANRFKHLAKVAVMPADGSFYAEMLVRDVGRAYAVCSLLSLTKFGADIKVPADADYDFKWAGPTAKFRVIRLSDNAVVSEGHADKMVAQVWLVEHLKAFKR